MAAVEAAVQDDSFAVALEACREIDLAVEMVDRPDLTDGSAVLVADDDYNFQLAAADCADYAVQALKI